MNKALLSPEIQDWIRENTGKDVSKLALAKNPFPQMDYVDLLQQVSGRTKAKSKLPTWFMTIGIVYPPKVSVEQTSSEKTAEYKARFVSGESLIDLTGGFGVDDFYFSKKMKSVVHCELDEKLSEIACHNFKMLGASNIECENGDSTEILKDLNRKFDWMYIDPSRRNDAKGKVFMLKDCLPDVPSLLDSYFSFSYKIMVKTAPLLDITAALRELGNVSAIHVVALENEVKELLFVMEKDFDGDIVVNSVNITKDNVQEFRCQTSEMDIEIKYSLPGKYLYEPNAAIYKSGAFDLVGNRFGLGKLHRNSHLYTSDELFADFPGRIFSIETVFAYDKSGMKTHLQNKKSNVSTRNFPETVEKLRSKWKIADGGNQYSFFTTANPNHKIVLLCAKI